MADDTSKPEVPQELTEGGLEQQRERRRRFLPSLDPLARNAGILALILTLFQLAVQVWLGVRRVSSTEADNGSSLELSYDPVQRLLEFNFLVVLRRSGTFDDLLKDASVRLVSLTGGMSRQTGTGEIQVSLKDLELEKPVSLPYPLRVGSTRLQFSVGALVDSQVVALLGAEGERRLDLELKADGPRQFSMGYCFFLTGEFFEGLLRSERRESRTFRETKCDSSRTGTYD